MKRAAHTESLNVSDHLTHDLLAALDRIAGGVRPGLRPAHARGTMWTGTFTPAPGAAGLTRAPHVVRPSTPVTVRFSILSGLLTAAENDPAAS